MRAISVKFALKNVETGKIVLMDFDRIFPEKGDVIYLKFEDSEGLFQILQRVFFQDAQAFDGKSFKEMFLVIPAKI